MASERPILVSNSYGKSRVRLLKLGREGGPEPRHRVQELSVNIALRGDFEAAHTEGDNANVLPTDTMKNTVYALAKDDPIGSPESFALRLARHFVDTHRPAAAATVRIARTPWDRAVVPTDLRAPGPHPTCFVQGGPQREVCEVTAERGGTGAVRSGITGLVLLKSAGSGFSGFARDRYTTLKETDDRIFCTSLTAWWTFEPQAAADPARAGFNRTRAAAQGALVEAFAHHESKSVQHTLYAMGWKVLETCPEVSEVSLAMPNKHAVLVDLSPFGLENRNEVFVPTDEPHGLIGATLARKPRR